MNSTGVSHIAFCVTDIDESLKFYRDIVGMIVDFDRIQDTTAGGLPALYAHSRSNRRQVRLRFAEDANPHFIMTTHPEDVVDGSPIKLDQIGISHFSFSMTDLESFRKHLVANGVKFASEMDSLGTGASFFVYDPDGMIVQFDQN
jgi:catechol 2,3-dioxygenase-like lactoylglutathione lyase family enzyme